MEIQPLNSISIYFLIYLAWTSQKGSVDGECLSPNIQNRKGHQGCEQPCP